MEKGKERIGKERKGKEIRRNICSNRRVKQATQSNKECDIAKGESDMKFIYKNIEVNDAS